MDGTKIYRSYEKILDVLSFSLAFSTLVTRGIVRGDIVFVPLGILRSGNFGKIFSFILLTSFIAVSVAVGGYKLARIVVARRFLAVTLGSFVAAIVATYYTHLFFSHPGGWIMNGGPGILGGPGGSLFDFVVYFLVAFVVYALLSTKQRLSHYFNTSLILLAIVILLSLPELYLIFFVVK